MEISTSLLANAIAAEAKPFGSVTDCAGGSSPRRRYSTMSPPSYVVAPNAEGFATIVRRWSASTVMRSPSRAIEAMRTAPPVRRTPRGAHT